MKYKSYIKLTLFLCALIFSAKGITQDAFQRFYTTDDRDMVNVGSIATADGGFYMLNIAIDDDAQDEVNLIQISKNNPKGNLEWTKEYKLKDETLITNFKSIDFVRIDDETLVVNGVTQNQSEGGFEDEKFIFKIDAKNGDLLWSNLVSDLVDQVLPTTLPIVLEDYNESFVTFNSHGNAAADTLGISRVQYDNDDNIISQIGYAYSSSSIPRNISAIADAITTIDSNHVITFAPTASLSITPSTITQLDFLETAIFTVDKSGSIKTGSSYSISPDSIADYTIQTLALTSTIDTGVVMAGVVLNNLTGGVSNYLIKTDSIGIIQWSKLIDGSAQGLLSQVNDVIEKPDGTIVLSAKYQETNTGIVGDYMIYFDSEGNVIQQMDYASDNSFFFFFIPPGFVIVFPQGEMNATPDNGVLYSTTGIDPATGGVSPYIIKADNQGNALCNDTLDLDIVRDFAFVRDTLVMGITNYTQVDTFALTDEDYMGYNIPVLQLLDTVYCPQDPIMKTLNATVEGATMYEWSTGETTPEITVFEEGEFSVTVTIGEKVCYALCDTSMITKQEFPMASIGPDLSGVCELGEVLLSAGSSTNIASAIWNTGSVENSISVNAPGTYSVVITDNCENTAEATITITDESFIIPFDAEIQLGLLRCIEGVPTQIVELVFEDPDFISSVLWNTGETTNLINGEESTTYSVTIENICGNVITREITVGELNTEPPTPTIETVVDSCNTFLVVDRGINVPVIGVASTIEWSNGATTDTIEILSSGTYSVTITDGCGNTGEASADIEGADALVFPDIFFPGGQTTVLANRMFGPYSGCPGEFTGVNYTLEIFNRFGNKVFETDLVDQKWNGVFSGSQAPRDVYMYQYSYDTPEGVNETGSGTVTLYR